MSTTIGHSIHVHDIMALLAKTPMKPMKLLEVLSEIAPDRQILSRVKTCPHTFAPLRLLCPPTFAPYVCSKTTWPHLF